MAKAVAASNRKKTPLKAKAGAVKSAARKKTSGVKKKSRSKGRGQALEARAHLSAPEDRERMIQYAAYHIAEKDGFQPGKEQEYWFQAEKQVSDLLRGQTDQTPTDMH